MLSFAMHALVYPALFFGMHSIAYSFFYMRKAYVHHKALQHSLRRFGAVETAGMDISFRATKISQFTSYVIILHRRPCYKEFP